jgi:hypothetical protein
MPLWVLGAISAALLLYSSVPLHADDTSAARKTNINLAVASNFYGVPPTNSAITDIINGFEKDNPRYTVTVVDNGARSTLADHIINGNKRKVDLFGI